MVCFFNFNYIFVGGYYGYYKLVKCKTNATDGTIGKKCLPCTTPKCKDDNAYCDSSNVCRVCLSQGNGNAGSACDGPCDLACNDGLNCTGGKCVVACGNGGAGSSCVAPCTCNSGYFCNSSKVCECTSHGDGSENSNCNGPCDSGCGHGLVCTGDKCVHLCVNGGAGTYCKYPCGGVCNAGTYCDGNVCTTCTSQ